MEAGAAVTEPADTQAWTPGPEDFGKVYDRYFARVYNYVRYRVREPDAADDVTARVFERVLDKFSSFRPERGPFETWLFSIVRNAVTDHFRLRALRSWLSLDDIRERPSGERPVDAALAADETRRELLDAVAGLGERERDIIGLKFGGGMTNRAIADLTGLGESNVGVILYRAVQKLQARLGTAENGHG
jgi:RNA polymerase sigma factor (sigma-70 family)